MTQQAQESAEPARVEMECSACGVTDALPKHHGVATGGGQQRQLHFGCCSREGCKVCEAVLAGAGSAP